MQICDASGPVPEWAGVVVVGWAEPLWETLAGAKSKSFATVSHSFWYSPTSADPLLYVVHPNLQHLQPQPPLPKPGRLHVRTALKEQPAYGMGGGYVPCTC